MDSLRRELSPVWGNGCPVRVVYGGRELSETCVWDETGVADGAEMYSEWERGPDDLLLELQHLGATCIPKGPRR